MRPLLVIVVLLIVLPFAVYDNGPAVAAGLGMRDRPLEGFGATTPGGSGGTSYAVTSLGDSGPGTLRDAVSASNRFITFSVAGTIRLSSTLEVTTHHLTVDGSTAPAPGITITAASSSVESALLNLKGCHDVIVRHIRVCDAPDPDTGDDIRIWSNAYNVVVDHCSVRRGGDGGLDISDGAHDVTVQWCIIADTVKNSLLRTNVTNVSLHHNLYCSGDERNPQLDDAQTVDMVNNVIYDWANNYGTRIRNGSTANVIKNCYIASDRSDESDALVIEGSSVYTSGNIMPPACGAYDTGSRLPAPAVTEMAAADARAAVLQEAGAFPRDAEDEDYVASVVSSPVEQTSWGYIKAMYR